MRSTSFVHLSAFVAFAFACAPAEEPAGEASSATVLSLSECEGSAVMAFVNAPSTDADALIAAGVYPSGARNVMALRAGPDGVVGSADDVVIASVAALDAVRGIGPASIRNLGAFVGPCGTTEGVRCVEDGATLELLPLQSGHGFCRGGAELDTLPPARGQRVHVCVPDGGEACTMALIRNSIEQTNDPYFERFCGWSAPIEPCGPVAGDDGECCFVFEPAWWCE